MSIFNLFKNDVPDLQFIDVTGANGGPDIVYPHYPPVLAKDVKPLKEHQEKKYDGEWTFAQCPGMFDYSRMGYIIPAWSNFHIKANKAGTVGIAGSIGDEGKKRTTNIPQPKPMDSKIVDGCFELQNGISPFVWNFPGAWKVMGKGNVSALLLPPVYHNPSFLNDLYMYPGVVDYNGFTTINFIVSPKRECEIEIKAGDPVMHVIPFITNKTITASYGPSTKEQNDYNALLKWFHEFNFYRRFYMIRKKYKLFKKVD